MMLAERIQEFLQRLTPLTRSSLLTELERLETCDGDIPGLAEILASLRAEFRKDGSPQTRINNPSRYFFCALGAAARRRRARACQQRAHTAWLAARDLGVDQPGSVADDGARLHQAN